MRVLSRFFLIEDDIMKPGTRTVMEKLARELIPEGAAGDFNQALMELGALVCTPRSPHCLTCPVMEHCAARHEGREESLPIKKKAKPPRPESRLAALVEGAGEHTGKVLLRQRPQEGLLARMWELPHVVAEAAGEEHWQRLLRETLLGEDGVAVQPLAPYMKAEHTFSHIRWEMEVYRCRLDNSAGGGLLPSLLPYHYRWAGPDELEQYALPNVFVRILRQYFGGGSVREQSAE
jgi:A/G-specific adenine glycosylase